MPKTKLYNLIRFIGKAPSVLQIYDDPEAEKTLLEATALELEPREKDKGWSSYWQVGTEQQENPVRACFASRRRDSQKLGVLRLPRELVEQLDIEINHSPDPDTFACIADLHYLLYLSSKQTRIQIARAIKEALDKGELTKDDFYQEVKKGEIKNLLENTYQTCRQSGLEPDLSKAQPWARELI
jgi:hypothetical protein